LFSLFMSGLSYFRGDNIILAAAGARPLDRRREEQVYDLTENLCITAGLPVPEIFIIEDDSLNALAVGRDPQHAAIALTRGLIRRLGKVELEGVIAHELSHIKNRDTLLATVAVTLVGMVALLSHWFLRMRFYGRGRSREGGQIQAILLLAGLALVVLSPFFVKLIQLAISRKREYLADASAAMLTRYPEGLALALEEIQSSSQHLKAVNPALSPLYIAEPRSKIKSWWGEVLSTHPPLEKRIKILRGMNV